MFRRNLKELKRIDSNFFFDGRIDSKFEIPTSNINELNELQIHINPTKNLLICYCGF